MALSNGFTNSTSQHTETRRSNPAAHPANVMQLHIEPLGGWKPAEMIMAVELDTVADDITVNLSFKPLAADAATVAGLERATARFSRGGEDAGIAFDVATNAGAVPISASISRANLPGGKGDVRMDVVARYDEKEIRFWVVLPAEFVAATANETLTFNYNQLQ